MLESGLQQAATIHLETLLFNPLRLVLQQTENQVFLVCSFCAPVFRELVLFVSVLFVS